MNTREAYQALLEGKKVRDCEGDVWEMNADGDLDCGPHPASNPMHSGYAPFEIVKAPATDEELVAEMERLSRKAGAQLYPEAASAYKHTALMLKTRKVSP